MECQVFLSGTTLRNPPWVKTYRDALGSRLIVIDSLDLTHVIQTKLRNLSQEVRSPEFSRQVLLALYECTSENTKVFSLTEPPDQQLYDGYEVLVPRQPLSNADDDITQFSDFNSTCDIDVFSSLVAQSNSFTVAQLLLLHLFAFLIDEVANYWRRIVREREALSFNLVLIALRHQLNCGFLIRSLLTPLLFFRQSIHPIALAT